MAYSSDLVRTKNWGTELMYDTDLEGQLDLIINWVMAALNSTTGHAHTGVANKSPKINVGDGLTVTSQAQGDVLYASSAAAFARLGAGTKGKCLTTGGAAANPSWEGMTTQGDIEYHDGTSRARLGAGTTGLPLLTKGAAANPAFEKVAADGMSAILGAWVDKSGGYGAQQAATDGFVLARNSGANGANPGGTDSDLVVYTDANADPTTIRGISSSIGGTTSTWNFIMCPVRKGDYWKVTKAATASAPTVYWIPLGS